MHYMAPKGFVLKFTVPADMSDVGHKVQFAGARQLSAPLGCEFSINGCFWSWLAHVHA
jgi:hypothetical protein